MGRRLQLAITFLVLVSLTLSLGGTSAMAQPSPQGQGGPPEVLVDRDGNRIFDNLEKRMAGAAEAEALPVIVLFDRPLPNVDLPAVSRQVGGFAVTQRLEIVDGIATNLNRGQITALTHLPFVKQVELDVPVYATLDTATYWTGVKEARAKLDVTGDRDGNPSAYSPADVVIAVLDTGIDATHQDLAGKVIAWKDFVNTTTVNPYDDHGHGTHVASIAAGTGAASGGTYAGVAPGAALVGVKVLNSSGSGSDSTIIGGINWVVDNRSALGVEILSMSIGTTAASNGTDALSLAVNNAAAAGIIPVIAAGNSGAWKSSIGSPGAAAQAITVGAMADVGASGNYLAFFSSRGPVGTNGQKPDLAAPGVAITAAQANSGSSYVAMSGTSMATPFTAGVVALMLDRNPALTLAQVKGNLQQTAIDMGPAGLDYESGYGRLDALAAVNAAGTPGSGLVPPPTPAADFVDGAPFTSGTREFPIYVPQSGYPLAVSLTIPDATCAFVFPGIPGCLFMPSYDYDVDLLNASGVVVASSSANDRQETITYTPSGPGNYSVRVYVCTTCTGGGDFYLDLSGAVAGSSPPPANQPPTAANDSATVNEDASVVVSILANDTDPDGDTLAVTAVSDPVHGTTVNNGTTVTYAPDTNFSGADSFTYTVADGKGGADSATVSVTVIPVNDPPVANDITAATNENTQLPITLSATDVDGDTLAFAIASGPSNGTLELSGNVATYTPAPNFSGADSFTYTASDGKGGNDAATVSITINAVNSAPTVALILPGEGTTVLGSGVLVRISASDPDVGQTLTVEWAVDGGAWSPATLNGAYYEAMWNTTTYANGSHTVRARASDGVSLPVEDVNVVTVSNPVTGYTVHVGDLDAAKSISKRNWGASVTVWVHGQGETPVAGAIVAGTWNKGGALTAVTCTTKSTGACTLKTTVSDPTLSSVTYTVTGITATGFTYDAELNHDPDGGSDGTSITVRK